MGAVTVAAPLDHADLPVIATAPLPATYEAAKRALAQCSDLDECQMWANKAEAMASYARQAKDDALRRMCDRIQARAIRRCGELLREIPAASEANLKQNRQDGAVPSVTRTKAASDAGLSERQRKTALRVANVPEDEFVAAVESDNPPTVSHLADQGKASADYLKGRDPTDFQFATRLIGLADDIVSRSSRIDVAAATRGLDEREREHVLGALDESIEWLTKARERVSNGI